MLLNEYLYFDNAATTSLLPEALDEMMSFLLNEYGNPSGTHAFARKAKGAIEEARGKVAFCVNAHPDNIVFTGSATESNNWAIRGLADIMKHKGKHIITTSIEHPSVHNTCLAMESQGFEITYLPVDSDGIVSPKVVSSAIRPNTVVVSVMWANNEVGSIQSIKAITNIAKEKNILFHTDAAQAVGKVLVDLKDVRVDALSMSAHKFGGPKGVGALYLRENTRISPLLYGGGQENSLRAGTENVAGIVGMGKAAEEVWKSMACNSNKMRILSNALIERVEAEIPNATLNGPRCEDKRLPNIVNFSFADIDGESLLMLLDSQGVCASGGSACSTNATDPSRVLMSLGKTEEEAYGSVRFSLGIDTTLSDVEKLVGILSKQVAKLRSIKR